MDFVLKPIIGSVPRLIAIHLAQPNAYLSNGEVWGSEREFPSRNLGKPYRLNFRTYAHDGVATMCCCNQKFLRSSVYLCIIVICVSRPQKLSFVGNLIFMTKESNIKEVERKNIQSRSALFFRCPQWQLFEIAEVPWSIIYYLLLLRLDVLGISGFHLCLIQTKQKEEKSDRIQLDNTIGVISWRPGSS